MQKWTLASASKVIALLSSILVAIGIVMAIGQGCSDTYDISQYSSTEAVADCTDPVSCPPAIVNQSTDFAGPVGLPTMQLSVEVRNIELYTYEVTWLKDNVAVQTGPALNLVLTNLQLASSGQYQARITFTSGLQLLSRLINVTITNPSGTPLTCAASAAKTWTVGGVTCQAPIGALPHLGTSTINILEAAGGKKGAATFQCVSGTLVEQPGATCAVYYPLDSKWVSSATACPTGYLNTLLEDDLDTVHAVNEGGANKGLRLCLSGIENFLWAVTCPAGYVNTLLLDDISTEHLLTEGSSSGTRVNFCIKGIASANWAVTCAAGQHWLGQITDDNDGTHDLGEDSNSGVVTRFCLTPNP